MQNKISDFRPQPDLLRIQIGDEHAEQGAPGSDVGTMAPARESQLGGSHRAGSESQMARPEITLTLPYPVSANRYWRTGVINRSPVVYVSKEAKAYRENVIDIAHKSGVMNPINGRVEFDYKLYPKQPKDWARRSRVNPKAWDDTVSCLDLDNAQKVLIDALKGVAFDDDKWIRKISAERVCPDGEARVVVTIRQYNEPTGEAQL